MRFTRLCTNGVFLKSRGGYVLKTEVNGLLQFCASPEFRNIMGWIHPNKVRLIIGKIDTSIPFEVGVKQGDSVAPVLFLFLMMAFAEVIEQE